MAITEILSALFRWFHVAAGILWIGMLYFINFVYAPFSVTMDGDTRRKVVPELIPRTLYWALWASLVTWITGVLLLFIVFYHGGLMLSEGTSQEFGIGKSLLTFAIVLVLAYVYDIVARTPIAKNDKVFAVVGFVLIAVVTYAFIHLGSFSYRAYLIHVGTLFGTIIILNGWMRIWPAQKKILGALREDVAPDPALLAQTSTRAKHNTYLSVPLVWTMINPHTVVPGANSWLYFLLVIAIGWLIVMWAFGKAARLKGF